MGLEENTENLGDFSFTGKFNTSVYLSRPLQYEINLANPVEGVTSVLVTAGELGMPEGEDETSFMEKFQQLASIAGIINVQKSRTWAGDDRMTGRTAKLVRLEK